MGDRAQVVFVDRDSISPAVYLHWNGSEVKGWLKEAGPTLRGGDSFYACARFIGFCHTQISGSLSLGVMNINPDDVDFKDMADGMDSGAFVVNVDTGNVVHYTGYGEKIPDFKIELFSG